MPSPRFPQSQLQRPRPPPPPHPGNYRAQKLQGSPQRPQRPEYPQQRDQDPQLARSRCEIVQRQLQRNEWLVSAGFQQSLGQGREERKQQQVARVVVADKMADVDSSKKLQQFEAVVSKEKSELRGNENDDDDDVVMDDGRRSPRANGDLIEPVKLLKSDGVKRPEAATVNGKMADKPDVVGLGETRVKDSNVAEGDNRLSAKLDEETRKGRSLGKEGVDDQMDEPERKLLKDQNEKENSNKENDPSIDSSPAFEGVKVEKESLKKEGGTKVTVQADMHSSSVPLIKDQSEKENSNRKDDEKTATRIDANSSIPSVEKNSNEEIKDAKQADTRSIPASDKVSASTEKPAGEEKRLEQSLHATSPEKPTKPEEDNSQQTRALTSKSSPDRSPMKEELKTPDKSSNIPLEASRNEREDAKESTKVQSGEEVKTPRSEETKEDRKERSEEEKVDSKPEIKSEDASKGRDEDEEESKVSEDAWMETSRGKEEEPEAKEAALDPDHSPKEKESSDPSPNLALKNADELEESLEEKSRPASGKEASETKLLVLSEDREKVESAESSPPMSPEEGTKGFDNGQQRSLSIKSSPSQSLQSPASPKSPKSPKSPIDDRKVTEGKVKTEEEKDEDKTTGTETKSLSKSATLKRAPASGKQDKKSRKKPSTTPGFYPFDTFATRLRIENCL